MNDILFMYLSERQKKAEYGESYARFLALCADHDYVDSIMDDGTIVYLPVGAPIRPVEELPGANVRALVRIDEGTQRRSNSYFLDDRSNVRNSAHHKSWKTNRRTQQRV